MTKTKKNRNKRIVLALLMLLVTAVALTTATYAWFSANTAVTATGIDVKVTASAGISISADALNFGKTTSMDNIIDFAKDTAFASTLQLPEELSPVSSTGINVGSKFSFYKGTLGENDVVLLENSTENTTFKTEAGKENYTGGDFMAFDVYIRSSIEQTIKLNSNSQINPLEGLDGANAAYLQSALRVGFTSLGTTTDASAMTSQASAYNLNDLQDDWKILNPYPYVHHSATLNGYTEGDEATKGYYGAKDVTTSVEAYSSLGELADPGAEDSHYVKFLYKDIDSSAIPGYYGLLDPTNPHYMMGTEATIVPDGSLLKVGAGVTKVRIYFWLEGNDVDCVDAISISDGLTVNLGFEVA